jgi:hypothetical protein
MSSRQKGMLLAGVAVLLLAVEIGAVLLLAAGARMMTGNGAARASLAAAAIVAETVAGGALRAGHLALLAADGLASRVLPVADALPLVHAPTLEAAPAVMRSLIPPAAAPAFGTPVVAAEGCTIYPCSDRARVVAAARVARKVCAQASAAPANPS